MLGKNMFEGYCYCGKCEVCESMLTILEINIHIINDHEPKMNYNKFERDWVMKHRKWIREPTLQFETRHGQFVIYFSLP